MNGKVAKKLRRVAEQLAVASKKPTNVVMLQEMAQTINKRLKNTHKSK